MDGVGTDWLEDASMDADETMRRFAALNPQSTVEPALTRTIEISAWLDRGTQGLVGNQSGAAPVVINVADIEIAV